jgi:hypothetical protein
MAGNEVKLTFAGDTKSLEKAAKDAQAATKGVADTATSAARDAQTFGDRMARTGAAAAGMSAAIDDAGSSVQALADFQNRGRERAMALARALSNVEQANLDAAQATTDLKQAQEDASQASLDVEQANLDAAKAQADYTMAVKEYGAGSLEAQQAALDLKQAQRDLAQANIDAEQATRDAAQANKDGRDAQLDLNEAMTEAHPSDLSKAASELSAYANLAAGVVGTINLLAFAHNALSLSAIKAAASTAAAKAATIAGTVATGIATAAQWLWNIALTANPIGIIIVAIGALIGVIIYLATQTRFFQTIWEAVWGFLKAVGAWFAGPFADFFVGAWNKITGAFQAAWDWIKNSFISANTWVREKVEGFLNVLRGINGALKAAFSKVTDIISAPFRAAFNLVARAWNNTVGRLHFSVPSWVPGIGGNSFSAPKLPQFHTGGIVSGAFGQETLAVLQAGERVTGGNNSGGQLVGTLRVVGNGDTALATFLHTLQRNGILQFELSEA